MATGSIGPTVESRGAATQDRGSIPPSAFTLQEKANDTGHRKEDKDTGHMKEGNNTGHGKEHKDTGQRQRTQDIGKRTETQATGQ